MHPINGIELFTRLSKGESLNLLDVREEIEFNTYNIGGKNIPLSKFYENIDQSGYNKTDEIILYAWWECEVKLQATYWLKRDTNMPGI
jgi:hypothetical protein